MGFRRKAVFLAALFITASIFASDAGGPPSREQLIGYWKMEPWPNPAMQKVNPWKLPHQWFAFFEDGRFMTMMSKEPKEYSAKELETVFAELPFDPPRFKLRGQFLMFENPEIEGYRELWGVNLFAKDMNDLVKKGDLVMSLAGDDGVPVYYRLLRRVR